jgi:signal transduction histidine kinase
MGRKDREKARASRSVRRISRMWLWRLFLAMLAVDIVLVAIAMGAFMYKAEASSPAGFSPWSQRSFSGVRAYGPYRERLDDLTYHFTTPEGQYGEADAGAYIAQLRQFLALALAAQGFVFLMQWGGGRRSAERMMKPVRQMTRAAEKISSERFAADKLHTLEDAIDSLTPSARGVRLSTGDRDLEGLEHAINNLLSRVHESYVEQTRFVSDASHELRTPIAVIQGYSDMLARWGKTDEHILEEAISAIQAESRNMNKLVEQLLFLARGDSGRNTITFAPFDLSDTLSEVCDEYKMIDSDHAFSFRTRGKTIVTGDEALIKQTARILMDNAVKYTPEGGQILLDVGMNGQEPFFGVQDDGIGIKPDDVPKVFDRFFRSDPARARKSGGAGLGLSIAKWIVESHGGYFEILSREGIGTRIRVMLPQPPAAGRAITRTPQDK